MDPENRRNCMIELNLIVQNAFLYTIIELDILWRFTNKQLSLIEKLEITPFFMNKNTEKSDKILVLFVTIELPTKTAPILFHKEINNINTEDPTKRNSDNFKAQINDLTDILFNEHFFQEK